MREDIDNKYLDQQTVLEAEFFNIVPDGKGQRRQLKEGKSIDDFNLVHGQIWKDHKSELITEGYAQPDPEPEPMRDLAKEIDELKIKVAELKDKDVKPVIQ